MKPQNDAGPEPTELAKRAAQNVNEMAAESAANGDWSNVSALAENVLVIDGNNETALRLRVRIWSEARVWLLAAGFPPRPTGDVGVRSVHSYIEELVRGEGPRSVPRSLVSALRLFESCGGAPEHDQVSLHPLIGNHC